MLPKLLSLLLLTVELGSKVWDLYVRIRKSSPGRKSKKTSRIRIFSL